MIEKLTKAISGRADRAGLLLLESCSSTWIFDGADRRFRRVPRGAPVSLAVPARWAEYHHLAIDKARSCFTVELDRLGTRILRVSLHGEPCRHCRRGAPDGGGGPLQPAGRCRSSSDRDLAAGRSPTVPGILE